MIGALKRVRLNKTHFVGTGQLKPAHGRGPGRATILEQVAALSVTRRHFKALAGGQHLTPQGQDFHDAFGVGTRDKHIATVDADGVALAAIQGLNQKVEDREQRTEVRSLRSEDRIQKLEVENAELKQTVNELKELLNSLIEKVNGGVP